MKIKSQDVIAAIDDAGFERKDISDRLFRITLGPREYSFIEIVAYRDIAFDSQIIGKLPELRKRLAEIKTKIHAQSSRRKKLVPSISESESSDIVSDDN